MPETSNHGGVKQQPATMISARGPSRIPVIALGMSLGLFLALTYVLCVGFDFLFPSHAMYTVWAPLLPGFDWISWSSFFLGLVEAFAYGWYVALVFGPLYNFFCWSSLRSSYRGTA